MRLLRFVSKFPRTVLLVALLLGGAAALASSRLAMKTAFAELLPDDDPGVVALRATQKRMGDLSLLLVGIRSPDIAANERYAEALTSYLRSLPASTCELATYHLREIHDFVRANRWLYLSEDDLEQVRDRLRKQVALRKNPLLVDLDEPDSDAALEQRLQQPPPLAARFPGGIFRSEDGTVWVAALPPGGFLAANAGEALLAATKDFIQRTPPSRFHPQMDVEPAGSVVTALRNRAGLQRDLALVASLCAVLIPLSIGLYFRRPKAVLFVLVPATLATVMAYGVAWLVFGYLTTVTSFLVSFIMGNGTNYAVMLLAHYEERRQHGLSAAAATDDAVSQVWRSTGVAALASAASYLSLQVTGFRGFSQFGLIGAAGCLLAWAATFTVVPALLTLFDGRGPTSARRPRTGGPIASVARAIERYPRWVTMGGAALTAVMLVGAAHFAGDAFEYDFRKLSTQGLTDARVKSFDKEKDALFGRWPQPTVILTDRAEDVPELRGAIRRADAAAPGNDVIGQMVTVDDLLPGTTEQQQRKLVLLEEITRVLDDPAMAALDDKQRAQVEQLRPPPSLHVLKASDLPFLAQRPFTEADGTVGRVLLLFPPDEGLSVWDGRALLRMAAVLQRVTLPDGREVQTSGTAVIFAAMIRSILHDGPLAMVASLMAVLLLVLLRVRPIRAALIVMASLLAGVSWMVGTAGWLGLRITFLNFIALPFIFGVGVEYAIHIVTEYRVHRSVRRTVVSAGGPVALCSWSAIVGYGSLLGANSGALKGLGGVAALGEVMCLLAAVVVLPAALRWASLASSTPTSEHNPPLRRDAAEPWKH